MLTYRIFRHKRGKQYFQHQKHSWLQGQIIFVNYIKREQGIISTKEET